MDEMSLRQQIKQIDDEMQYILLICEEASNLEKNITDSVSFLRQSGLRTETAEMMQHVFLEKINCKLESMLNRMRNSDYEYLSNVKSYLEQALKQ